MTIRITIPWIDVRSIAPCTADGTKAAPPQNQIPLLHGRSRSPFVSLRCACTFGIKRPDCAFAAREGAPFVTVGRDRPIEGSHIQRPHGEAIGACPPRPPHIDLGAGDPAGHRETLRTGTRIRPRDGARQGGNLVDECGIKPCGSGQAVADGVARRARLAFGRPRAAAAAAVPPAGFASGFADHAGSGAALFPLCSIATQGNTQAKSSPRSFRLFKKLDAPEV